MSVVKNSRIICFDRGPSSDHALGAAVAHLVAGRPEHPNAAGYVQIAGSHLNNLTGSHAGQPLEFDHRPHAPADVGLDRIHECAGDRFDRFAFARASVRPRAEVR